MTSMSDVVLPEHSADALASLQRNDHEGRSIVIEKVCERCHVIGVDYLL